MSEFGEFYDAHGEPVRIADLLQTNTELRDSYTQFDHQRLNLYGWLEEKSAELPSVFSLTTKAAEYIGSTAEAFAESSLCFKRHIQDESATKRCLTQLLLDDDAQRVQRFSGLVPQPSLEFLAPEDAVRMITAHMTNSDTDDTLSVRLRDQYYSNARADVTLLLEAMQTIRDQHIQRFAADMPLSSPDSIHVEFSPDALKALSQEYGRLALKAYL